jgi:hypothetical protein
LTTGVDSYLVTFMTLRDHPLMSYRGLRNWPPVWTQTRDDNVKTVKGEIGVLTYVYSNPRMSSRCFLVIDYEGDPYVGALIFESHTFCDQITHLLWGQINRSIREIGNLNLSHTL